MKEIGIQKLSFADWYDIVGQFYRHDGIASHHNLIIAVLIHPFVTMERKKRRAVLAARADARIRAKANQANMGAQRNLRVGILKKRRRTLLEKIAVVSTTISN